MERRKRRITGFYTKLNVWGSLGLNFDYDGGSIIENGGPISLFVYKIGFVLLNRCRNHQVIFVSQPFVAT